MSVQRFAALFQGFTKAHGKYHLKGTVSEKGKAEGSGATSKTTPLLSDWQNHLDGGGTGIGIIPLLDDNKTVKFAVIDIDTYKIDHAKIEAQVRDMPLVLCRSKSGGAHLYIFFKTPVLAKDAQEKLAEVASILGHGGCEIFPKQNTRVSEQDIGNWINLPYYKAAATVRYAFRDGKAITFEEFLDYAEQKSISSTDFAKFEPIIESAKSSELFVEGPPCLNYLACSGGFPDGTRNEGLFNVAVYLRKRFPDDWENHLQEYNIKMCSPALSLQEINTIVKSIKKKEYNFRCKQPPISPHCNRRKCLKQAYGVADTTGARPVEVTAITKYEGEPTLWVLEIDGKRIQCDTDTLYSQTNLNKVCMEKINRLPGSMPKNKWEKYLDELISGADIVPVPEDASASGQFWILVEQFCTGRVQAKHKDELLAKKPWRDSGKIYFQSRALIEYLDRHRFKYKSEHHVWQMLRDKGADKTFFTIKGKGVNVWYVPEPQGVSEEMTPLPDMGSEAF